MLTPRVYHLTTKIRNGSNIANNIGLRLYKDRIKGITNFTVIYASKQFKLERHSYLIAHVERKIVPALFNAL